MKNGLIGLGVIVVSAIMIAIPMLLAFSILLHWEGFFIFLLTILTIVEFVGITSLFYRCIGE